MEEFYLISNGEMTKTYESVNPKEDQFEISLFPSIVYAANKLKKTDSKIDFENLEQIINDWLNNKMDNTNPNTSINNAKNVIINNGNKNKTEINALNSPENKKDKIGLYSLIAGLIGLIISIVIGWKEIVEFFTR